MRTIFNIVIAITLIGCKSDYYFYSGSKARDITEYRLGSIKNVIDCAVTNDGSILYVQREAFDTANYRKIVYPSYIDSIRNISNVSYSFIIAGTNDTLKADTLMNSLSFGYKPKDAFYLKSPMPSSLCMNVVYEIDSLGKRLHRVRTFKIFLHKEKGSSKGLGGC